ncbi:unnamed protein product [Sphenostylis stenocarpa]|uniref:Uncharacterized protein n=1 Tax=Sphenostylis stenocarpa TaxID=92480 RepID=A0AA86T0B2_9FABA|nr:unnamed protein product [Sphenostylis stenocarpa]
MQAAKKAVENVKETAANIGASAKSGLEKTKATLQEKSEQMSAHDQREKDMATQKKHEKINHAEMEKHQAREHNAAVKHSALAAQAHGAGTHSEADHTTGPSLSGPGSDNVTYTGSGTETSIFNRFGPGADAILPGNGHGPDSASYCTVEFGQIGSNQMVAMPGPDHGCVIGHGAEPGPGHGGLPPMETNTGVDTTTQTSIGGGNAPTSGPTFS